MPSDPAVELDIRGIPYIWCPGGCHKGVFGVYLDMLLWWCVEVYMVVVSMYCSDMSVCACVLVVSSWCASLIWVCRCVRACPI